MGESTDGIDTEEDLINALINRNWIPQIIEDDDLFGWNESLVNSYEGYYPYIETYTSS